jgi:hypothetical protein
MTAAKDIPAELVERMVNVIRAHTSVDNAPVNGKSQWAEFLDIAAALPKPVDPEKEIIRKVARECDWIVEQGDDGLAWVTSGCSAMLALTCFRAGRQYERDNS